MLTSNIGEKIEIVFRNCLKHGVTVMSWVVHSMRQLIARTPKRVLPVQLRLPLPHGMTNRQVYEFVTSIRVENGPEDEMRAYATHDFLRFVYTWQLASDVSGKCLELGANPYFTTMLLKKFTSLDLFLANYFGSLPNAEHAQNVIYHHPVSGAKETERFLFQHFNVENDAFPYNDGTFDLVIFAEIIEHLLNDPCKVLREIKRILAPEGTLILTTPNVSRMENVARMITGMNIYDPYSGYGPYGRHNREYTRGELIQLLEHEGFDLLNHFTADVHTAKTPTFHDSQAMAPMLRFREHDLGEYIFIKAKIGKKATTTRPAWLYRSYPEGALA